MRQEDLKQRVELRLSRGGFNGLYRELQALSGWMKRNKDGKGSVNGPNSLFLVPSQLFLGPNQRIMESSGSTCQAVSKTSKDNDV